MQNSEFKRFTFVHNDQNQNAKSRASHEGRHTCPDAETRSIVGVCSSGRSSAASGVPGQEDGVMDSSIQLASVSGVMLPSVNGRSVYGVMVPSIPS